MKYDIANISGRMEFVSGFMEAYLADPDLLTPDEMIENVIACAYEDFPADEAAALVGDLSVALEAVR